ncbi:PilT/PilU family type 4a pilus ATPase [Leifsonia poae]|uniref:type IV pilus twitching motility protein PilT n=1 Tax=Leifsonia poae TaxID=110933 RepID=UPI003D68A6ED
MSTWEPPEGKPIYEIPVTPERMRPDEWFPAPVPAPTTPPVALPALAPAPTAPPVVHEVAPESPPPLTRAAARLRAVEDLQPVAQPFAQPIPQPVAPPIPQPVAPPVPQSVASPVPQPVAQPDPQPDIAPVATLTDAEREALAKADPDLVEALRQIVEQRGSDLHVTVGAPPMIRVDGGLRPVGSGAPWDRPRVEKALFSLLTDRQADVFRRELELDFAFTISANARFRVNLYQQRGAYGAAFRLIPTEIKQLDDLGIPAGVGEFAGLPRGLVLVTGPTGSGKSTTLAALIDLVNANRSDHIVTVEDPIEFMHTHKRSIVNQREVGHDTHSFANALKHVLRQDPDVILIGELRDLETISVALTAAETGHLVFATLHTQDAPQTIDRVIDVFPPHQQDQVRAQLAATLQGVVCQTLVRRANGKGRAVATEVLKMTPAIANLIREGKTYQVASMMQAGRDLGMHTMDQQLADLVNRGVITHRVGLEKAHDPSGFSRLVQRVESPGEASARALAAAEVDFGDSYSGTVR